MLDYFPVLADMYAHITKVDLFQDLVDPLYISA